MNPGTVTTVWPNSAAAYYRLNIGGGDVLNKGSATGYQVRRETIILDEEGPGGVSQLRFTISDPLVQVTLQDGQDVEFWDIAKDRPLFRGFIQNLSILPTAVGRDIAVTCIGIECLLDWILVPYCVVPAGTWLPTALQSLVYNMSGIGWPIRAVTQPPGSEDYGSQEYPIAGIASGFPLTTYDLTFEGQSLREAIQTVIGACNTWASGSAGGYATIDFYGQLRFLNGNGPGSSGILTMSPSADYNTFRMENVLSPSASRHQADGIDFRLDSAGVTRAVYIVGGVERTTGVTPIGSGLVSDGTGIPGPVAYINDETSVTNEIRDQIGLAYLGGFSQTVRGTATFSPMQSALLAADNYRPGSYFYYYPDSQVMGSFTIFSIFAIHKTFGPNGLESWRVDFGGMAPSAPARDRRLTRNQRS